MLEEKLTSTKTGSRFEVNYHHRIRACENESIWKKVRKDTKLNSEDAAVQAALRKVPKEVEEDLLAEVQRLRAEWGYFTESAGRFPL